MSRPTWARQVGLVSLLVVYAALVFLVRLDTYGLWEPWEVDRVEGAVEQWGTVDGERPDGEDVEEPGMSGSLPERLIASAHGAGGSEAGLRLPGAIAAVVTAFVALFLGAALFGLRSSSCAAVVLCGMPVFLFTGRLLLWSPLPVLAYTLVVGGAALVFFGRFGLLANALVGSVAVLVGAAVGYGSVGALLGVAMPLLGAAAGLAVARAWNLGKAPLVLFLVVLLATCAVVVVLALDGLLVPERARSDTTFEELLMRILHGTFPWTGLIVVGLGALARPEGGTSREQGAAAVLLTSAMVAFGVQTIWREEASGLPFSALWPLAMGAGLVLDGIGRNGGPRRIAALFFALFTLLGLRDHVLEPAVALAPLGGEVEFPEGLTVWWWHVAVTVALGLPLTVALARGRFTEPLRVREWFLRTFGWLLPGRRDRFDVRWIVVAVSILLLLHALLAAVAPGALWLPFLACLERRIWMAAGLLVPAMLAIAVIARALWEITGRLERWIVPAAVFVGALFALATAHVAIPEVSRHVSNRSVILAYERLATEGEPLYSYRASTAASQLVGGPAAEEVSSVDALVRVLSGSEKAFAVIRSEDLARVDVGFRKVMERHVPVADDESSSTYLLASKLADELDRNPLNAIVPTKRPTPRHTVVASFEDRVELIGYDVDAPGGRDHVCPADAFTLRLYWRCVRAVSGSKKVFVHIDGYGLRINGDHEPANGSYVVSSWQPGDFVVDEQKLRVPLHFRPGDYTIYVGLFQGSTRMKVVDGPATSDNRVKAGVLAVR